MSLSSLFKRPPAPPPAPKKRDADALVELLYAGNALATYLIFPKPGTADCECVCGVSIPVGPVRVNHNRSCPVNRFMIAVEVMRKEAL